MLFPSSEQEGTGKWCWVVPSSYVWDINEEGTTRQEMLLPRTEEEGTAGGAGRSFPVYSVFE
jgi:hypothetical protein